MRTLAVVEVVSVEAQEGVVTLKLDTGFGEPEIKFAANRVVVQGKSPIGKPPTVFLVAAYLGRYLAAVGFFLSYPLEAVAYRDYDAFVKHRRATWQMIWAGS